MITEILLKTALVKHHQPTEINKYKDIKTYKQDCIFKIYAERTAAKLWEFLNRMFTKM